MRIIRVKTKVGLKDPRVESLKRKAKDWLGVTIKDAVVVDSYLIDADLIQKELEKVKEKLLVDPISQEGFYSYSDLPLKNSYDWIIQVGFKPGVKDTEGERTKEAIKELIGREINGKVHTSTEYLIGGNLNRNDLENLAKNLLGNELIHRIKILETEGLREKDLKRFSKVKTNPEKVRTFEPENLETISERRNLALSKEDLEVIEEYFNSEKVIKERGRKDLSKITDVELEAIAQTQSEHCKHKIFNAKINYLNKSENKEEEINSLIDTYIKRSTREINPDWVLSTFWDNAGVIEFNEDYAVSMKFETHNSPSAKEPYGGAMTGIVGVYRDLMGTGKGSRIIAGAYGFCTPNPFYQGKLNPEIAPKRLLEGIVEGVRDGGNKSGVPTIIGYSKYDNSFLGKPLVYVGALGLIPKEIQHEKSWKKDVEEGDLIIMVGGRVGRDGIHGVTESSLEFSEAITSGHVQIGDPFTQKKVHDFLIEARDQGLYKLVWDLGGGGLSSAVGETARFSGGCELELNKVPLKYEGLNPWEILVSESQERMLLGVNPEKFNQLKKLAEKHAVEISEIGVYKNNGKFQVKYKGKSVAWLDMDFLHKGFPQFKLQAEWNPPERNEPILDQVEDHGSLLKTMLSRPNIASKGWIQRQYDHEVQGTSIIKPLVGNQEVDSDASVIRPVYNSREGLALSLGNCFKYSQIDPYWMTACSLDEAIRRVISVGASLDRIALNDNFCWPNSLYDPEGNPEGKENLGKLVRANKALYKFTKEFGTPCISGKDSMFITGNLRDREGKMHKISGCPSLQFSALGKVENVEKCIDLVPKSKGDLIYIIGKTKDELGASEYYEMKGFVGRNVPKLEVGNSKLIYKKVSKAIDKELLESCHGVYRGGLGIALAKKSISADLGMEVELEKIPREGVGRNDKILYSESPSRFIVTVKPENKEKFETLFSELTFSKIGEIKGKSFVIYGLNGNKIIDLSIDELRKSYKRTFEEF